MHHGQEPLPDELIEGELGATKRYPDGRLRPDDKGEIRFGVTVLNGKVGLHFGPKPVTWVGMTRGQANDLADILRQRASEIATSGDAPESSSRR